MNPIRKAVVLAAGRGTRMGSLTEELPKPMLPIDGKPMLWYILDELRGAGLTECALVLGYRREVIQDYFRGEAFHLEYLVQNNVNGTATAAGLARQFVGSEAFLLTFGDILSASHDYSGMCAELADGVSAVAAVRRVEDPWRGAAVYETGGDATRIIEKPERGTSTTPWNSAGLYVFRPSIFEEIDRVPLSPRGEFELTSAVSQILEKGERVRIYEMRDVWRDVGTPEDLKSAAGLVQRLRRS